ncbi:hypothetical protein Tco_1030831 [Tanacetum coccineum]|uniref:Uncharacterized protein n=1 Tax=Tanacetum coccineum TaxID=301880 RepID=A0ABQ5G7S3_9ASTR
MLVLLEVIEFKSAQSNTTAKLPILKLTQENGTSVTKMLVPVTAKEKTNKKNDVKARSLLLMALPNEHQLTFSQYSDAKTMFAAIKTRFGGVVITQEDLNLKFLRSLPPKWNTHVVVWMNKADIETMSIDDLYNNFKIVEQDVKKSVGASSGAQNLAFMTAPSTSSTNDVNTANPAYEVSTVSPNINIACPQVSTANFSDNTMYAFMVKNPNGSNLLQQDLEQIHEDDLEAMDLKWQLSLLSMRAKRYFQRTEKKIFINANDTVGYDKSKQGNNEDTSSKTMLAIDGVCFNWSDMAQEQVQTNMALMAFLDSKTVIKPSQPIPLENDNNPRVLWLPTLQRRTIDQSAGGKLRDLNAKESWPLLEDLDLYENESWNDPRDFAKPVKAITLPQDVLSTSDRCLIELKNNVQCLMEAHLALTQPTQVNKITTSREICSGPYDT